ncbi:MAG TPA: amino acid adenylation domain-containing protein, partial [Vicinamibacterales bacterium]|nr:amino acid adenylation domain-containing protein [Vicinamibacterales bacterium]
REALLAHARRQLPDYMVPSAVVVLDALPQTPTGKLDPKTLPAPDYAATHEYIAPRTTVEELLAGIWTEVLGVPRVGIEDGFIEIGGDSILAIRVASRARRAGLELTPRQLFEYPTIAQLAAVTGVGASPPRAEQARVEGTARLAPIQRWFFEQELAIPSHYNQTLLLEVDASIGDDIVERALAAVLEHHDALRLRFRRTDAGWQQWHAESNGVALERIDLAGLSREEQDERQRAVAAEQQVSLDLEHGPLGRAVLIDRGAGRQLLLVLHHLIVDGVSCRILREDLERACDQAAAGTTIDLGPKTTSYRQWADALQTYAESDAAAAEAAHWLGQGADGVGSLPEDASLADTSGRANMLTARLSADATRALLREVPAAYRTQINDVLLCALAETMSAWSGSSRVRVALEGHGREEQLVSGADLTRTVGWFTTVYPAVLDVTGSTGAGDRLKRVKEQLRAVPQRGIGYGVLRYVSTDASLRQQLAAQDEPQILFNYLGQFEQETAGSTRIRYARGPRGRHSAETNQQRYLLDINATINAGCLELQWTYQEDRHRRETIERLATAYLRALEGLVAHCLSPDAGGCTPSDFPLAGLTQDELDVVVGRGSGIEDLYPLSPMQEGMLFHALSGIGAQAYQVESACRLEGDLDVAILQRSWADVVSRHPILRTAFLWDGLRRPLQRVHAAVEIPWRVEDWRSLSEAAQLEALERHIESDRVLGLRLDEAPLMRCALFRVGDNAQWFVWARHHLLMDGWAGRRVLSEVFRLYEAWTTGQAVALKRVGPYRDYVAWLGRQDVAAAERYWRRVLAGYTVPVALPFEAEAHVGDGRPAKRSAALPSDLTVRLEEAARQKQVTLNTLLLGAWGLLISRYAGEEDVVFGATVSGRSGMLEGAEDMVGLFINTLPVRIQVRGDARLDAWLQDVQRSQMEAREYDYAPLVQVQQWSELPPGAPLFDTNFIFENYPVERGFSAAAQSRLRVTAGRDIEWSNYPLTLVVCPDRELRFHLSYDAARIPEDAIERIVTHLTRLLEEIATGVDLRLSEIEILGDAERAQLTAWSDSRRGYTQLAAHACVADAAGRAPQSPAVLYGDQVITYASLERRAKAVARRLRAHGVGPETRVGLCIGRTPDLLACVLAIWKAGGAFVPLDPSYPAERLDWIISDAELPVIVTAGPAAQALPRHDAIVVSIDDLAADEDDVEPFDETPVAASNLAYVIYTSGSTGRPKGVLVEHGSLASLLAVARELFGVCPGDVMPALASYAFDIWLLEAFLPLTAGAAVRTVDRERVLDVPALVEEVADSTLLHTVPALMREVVQAERKAPRLRRLRRAFVGGDRVPADLLTSMCIALPRADISVLYGPTEGTILATVFPVAHGDEIVGHPIGRPLGNTRLYVCDARSRLQPIGVAGELLIGGPGVSRGYLGRAGQTAACFVPDPFSADEGARLYRTGDRARWRSDGTLEFLGRIDRQVKIRGFRIELGEIEAVLRQHHAVSDCTVQFREDQPGEPHLVAYVVGAATATDLRDHLQRAVPDYMVPSVIVSLERLPLTPNGKLDVRALPSATASTADEIVGSRTPVEEALAEIWTDVLRVARVSVTDNFFALGGHSLLVMRLAGDVQAAFGIDLPVRTVFALPTLESMAAEIERRIYEDTLAMPEADAQQAIDLNSQLQD